MYNVKMYHENNFLPRRDARQCLEEYAKEINWKEYGANIMDIGCGDGSVTSILKTFVPNNYKSFVACDVNQEMVEFANAHYAKDSITFTVLDITSDIPDQFREKIDHAFSFFALNWIKDQKIAFSNVYNLLTRGGNCLLMSLGRTTLYEVYRELARSPRWNYWMKDVEQYVSSYHDAQDPEKDIKTMMTTIGFTDVNVKCLPKVYVYPAVETFKNVLKAVNAFKVPMEMEEEFFDDHIKLFHDMGFVDHNVDGPPTLTLKYNEIIAYGKK